MQTAMLLAAASSWGRYWTNFWDYWRRTLVTDNGIVMITLLVGALGIFIITRGKWMR